MLAGNVKALLPEPSQISLPAVAFGLGLRAAASSAPAQRRHACPSPATATRSSCTLLQRSPGRRRERAGTSPERRGPDRIATADHPRGRRLDRHPPHPAAQPSRAPATGVAEAADGAGRARRLPGRAPDLVLLDVDMPVMDGPTALAAMQSRRRRCADIPVLFLTAREPAETDVAAGLELGAQDYLRKPCEPAELIGAGGRGAAPAVQEETLRGMATEVDRAQHDRRPHRPRQPPAARARIDGAAHGATGGDAPVGRDDHRRRPLQASQRHRRPLRSATSSCASWPVACARRSASEHLLVRWGGEEFVVLATGLDEAALAELAERLRAVDRRPPVRAR